jgi:signal transduction histidine kinase
MGIGLSLSKTIIEAHHGTLNIYSEGEDSGAMVKIVLPVDFTQEINKKV